MSKVLNALVDDAPAFPIDGNTAIFPNLYAEAQFLTLVSYLAENQIHYVDYGLDREGCFAMTFNNAREAVQAKLAFDA